MLLTGIDLVEIERIAKSLESEAFLKRVYGETEQKQLEQLRGKAKNESAAAFFAAKEAFGKAIGCGIFGFSLSEVQVSHEKSGRPFLLLSGKALTLALDSGCEFALSLSHSDNYAVASVVATSFKER